MIKIGGKYETNEGKKVIIERAFKCSDGEVMYKGSNQYDYNEKGEAFFVLMYRGRFKSELNNIKQIN